MISANTEELLRAARQLAAQADAIEQTGAQLEQRLREQRGQSRILFLFSRAARDVRALKKQRVRVLEKLRTQSLYLRECAKQYKGAQSWTVSKFDRLG